MQHARFIAIPLAAVLAHWLAASIASADSAIYRCEVDGVMTYADRPCGERSAAHVPDASLVSTYDAPVVKNTGSPKTRARPKRRAATSESIAAAQVEHAQECERIDTSLRDVRSRMRAGYNTKQGERLKERYSKLNAKRRSQRC